MKSHEFPWTPPWSQVNPSSCPAGHPVRCLVRCDPAEKAEAEEHGSREQAERQSHAQCAHMLHIYVYIYTYMYVYIYIYIYEDTNKKDKNHQAIILRTLFVLMILPI